MDNIKLLQTGYNKLTGYKKFLYDTSKLYTYDELPGSITILAKEVCESDVFFKHYETKVFTPLRALSTPNEYFRKELEELKREYYPETYI